MVDYKKNTGVSGTMMIRDTGSVVEFWITANNTQTYHYQMPWGYTVNGVTNNNREYRYERGAGWEKLGSWTVTTDQTVTFRLGATGTNLGGPTSFSQFIQRASHPDTPSPVSFSNLTGTSVTASFTDGADNGAPIDSREIAWGLTNNVNSTWRTNVGSNRTANITGLSPGTTYYFWSLTHNAKGYSPWSAVRTVTTHQVPETPYPIIVSDITQSSVRIVFQGRGDGGMPVLEWAMYYNSVNNPNGAASVAHQPQGVVIPNLKPGTTYYFWSRGRNAVGWSPYSAVTVAETLAGVRINVNGVWVKAVPYVNVNGVWKPARPWGRVGGFWRETL